MIMELIATESVRVIALVRDDGTEEGTNFIISNSMSKCLWKEVCMRMVAGAQ